MLLSTQAIINAVHSGVGISFLPEKMIEKYLKEKYIATCFVTNIVLKRNNYLVWHKHKYLTQINKEIINLFKKEMKY